MSIASLSRAELQAFHDRQVTAYEKLLSAGMKLDITRGKPSAEQLDLSNALLDLPGADFVAAGVDVRNYGGGTGIAPLREIFSDLLRVPVDQLLAGENASLSMMHDVIVFSLLHGLPGAEPWSASPVKFIAPVPGYDRHFAICEHYGIEMLPVDMHDDGPDLNQVRELVKDPAVKGMWLVPTYANPTGAVVSEQVAAELAAIQTAAPDFRIFWDNAYAVHHLTEARTKTADILGLCSASGHPDRPFIFASTSKITFAGAGVCFLGGSADNIAWYLKHTAVRSIGPDKLNQWRHVKFLKDADGVLALMEQHRQILAPKFAAVDEILSERVGPYDIATWNTPVGGYFVNLDVPDGTASRVVQLAKDAGLALTPAGAAFPYGKDPHDRNIRIAPSFPPLEELRAAIEALCVCVLYAATEKLLG